MHLFLAALLTTLHSRCSIVESVVIAVVTGFRWLTMLFKIWEMVGSTLWEMLLTDGDFRPTFAQPRLTYCTSTLSFIDSGLLRVAILYTVQPAAVLVTICTPSRVSWS